MNHPSDKHLFGSLSFEGVKGGRLYQYVLVPRADAFVLSPDAGGGTARVGYAQVEGIQARAAIADFLRSLISPWGRPRYSASLRQLQRLLARSSGFATNGWIGGAGRAWQIAVGDELESRFVLLRREIQPLAAPEDRERSTEEPLIEPAESTEKTWIKVRVEDEDGNPIGNADYELKTPDGEIHEGQTDGDGVIHYDDLTASGSCELTLPELEELSASA